MTLTLKCGDLVSSYFEDLLIIYLLAKFCPARGFSLLEIANQVRRHSSNNDFHRHANKH